MLPEIPREELAAAIDEIVTGVLRAAEIAEPPIDALRVAAGNGVVVAIDNYQTGRARYVRLQSGGRAIAQAASPSILIREDDRPERRQWAVAHELGEHLAHELFALLAIDPREAGDGVRESAANYLAARLLLPTGWFRADAVACDWELSELKQRYATASHELIARRMLDFSAPICITIFDHGRLTARQSNQGGRVPSLSPLERAAWLAAHEHGQPAECVGDELRVRAWPIHEPEWKREILRTEITDGGEF
jgi:Zn-dependent peptidase ImmA (M78 family)